MSAETSLLPCPFCGTAERDGATDFRLGPELVEEPGAFRVECRFCGCEAGWSDTAEEAVAAWNRRPEPAPSPFAGGDSPGRVAIEVPCANFRSPIRVFLQREKWGWLVGAEDDSYRGPVARIDYDDTWLNIITDDYEGAASLNIETLPALQQALVEIAAALEAAK